MSELEPERSELTPKARSRRLNTRERELRDKILSDPFGFPQEFTGWLPRFTSEQITLPDLKGPAQLSSFREAATADLALTTSDQDVTGCSVTLGSSGTYLVWGVFDFHHSASGGGVAVGSLYVDGTAETSTALLDEAAVHASVSQVWLVSTSPDIVVKLAAKKTVNAGTVEVKANHTTITVLRVA